MKKYLSFFRMRFLMGLQYRAAAAAGVVTQFTWGFMELLVFRAFYQADASAFPMSFEAVASYIWLQQAFLALFMAWMMEAEIFSSIVDGNIAYEMCRPVHIYSMLFARSVANRVSKALLRCAPILVVALFLPKPYRLMLPQDPMTLFLFLLTMILGTLVTVAIGVIIYTSACELLSGQIVPLPFMPEVVQRVLKVLPFAAMQNVPFRIYSGDLSGRAMAEAIFLQIFWLIVLVGAGWRFAKLAEKKLVVQGG